MSALLNHLVGMALGRPRPGAARLSLPSRYASRPASDTSAGWEVTETAESIAVSAQVGLADAGIPTHARHRRSAAIDAAADHRPATVRHISGQEQQPVAPASAGREGPMPPALRVSVAPEFQMTHGVPPTMLTAATVMPPSLLRTTPPTVQEMAASTPIAAAQPIRTQGVPTVAAPLRKAVVAIARATSAEPAPPVVHVTIDRIDVRAPETTRRTSEPRRPRPAPSVSLSDYLRDGIKGGRG